MPPMPPDFYIPAFTAVVTAMGFLVAVGGKIILTIWNRFLVVSDRGFENSVKQTAALNATSESLIKQAEALIEIKEVVKGIQHEMAKQGPRSTERYSTRQDT